MADAPLQMVLTTSVGDKLKFGRCWARKKSPGCSNTRWSVSPTTRRSPPTTCWARRPRCVDRSRRRQQQALVPRRGRVVRHRRRRRPQLQVPPDAAALAVAADALGRHPHLSREDRARHHQGSAGRLHRHGDGRTECHLRQAHVLRAVPRDRFQLRQPADGRRGHLLFLPPRRRTSTNWSWPTRPARTSPSPASRPCLTTKTRSTSSAIRPEPMAHEAPRSSRASSRCATTTSRRRPPT